MCGNVSDDCILCSLCEMMCVCLHVCVCVECAVKEGACSGVTLALLSIRSNIPPLIETRAPPPSSLNKELLFPPRVYSHVCIQNYLLSRSSCHLDCFHIGS